MVVLTASQWSQLRDALSTHCAEWRAMSKQPEAIATNVTTNKNGSSVGTKQRASQIDIAPMFIGISQAPEIRRTIVSTLASELHVADKPMRPVSPSEDLSSQGEVLPDRSADEQEQSASVLGCTLTSSLRGAEVLSSKAPGTSATSTAANPVHQEDPADVVAREERIQYLRDLPAFERDNLIEDIEVVADALMRSIWYFEVGDPYIAAIKQDATGSNVRLHDGVPLDQPEPLFSCHEWLYCLCPKLGHTSSLVNDICESRLAHRFSRYQLDRTAHWLLEILFDHTETVAWIPLFSKRCENEGVPAIVCEECIFFLSRIIPRRAFKNDCLTILVKVSKLRGLTPREAVVIDCKRLCTQMSETQISMLQVVLNAAAERLAKETNVVSSPSEDSDALIDRLSGAYGAACQDIRLFSHVVSLCFPELLHSTKTELANLLTHHIVQGTPISGTKLSDVTASARMRQLALHMKRLTTVAVSRAGEDHAVTRGYRILSPQATTRRMVAECVELLTNTMIKDFLHSLGIGLRDYPTERAPVALVQRIVREAFPDAPSCFSKAIRYLLLCASAVEGNEPPFTHFTYLLSRHREQGAELGVCARFVCDLFVNSVKDRQILHKIVEAIPQYLERDAETDAARSSGDSHRCSLQRVSKHALKKVVSCVILGLRGDNTAARRERFDELVWILTATAQPVTGYGTAVPTFDIRAPYEVFLAACVRGMHNERPLLDVWDAPVEFFVSIGVSPFHDLPRGLPAMSRKQELDTEARATCGILGVEVGNVPYTAPLLYYEFEKTYRQLPCGGISLSELEASIQRSAPCQADPILEERLLKQCRGEAVTIGERDGRVVGFQTFAAVMLQLARL